LNAGGQLKEQEVQDDFEEYDMDADHSFKLSNQFHQAAYEYYQ
jgi:hypothetical protein